MSTGAIGRLAGQLASLDMLNPAASRRRLKAILMVLLGLATVLWIVTSARHAAVAVRETPSPRAQSSGRLPLTSRFVPYLPPSQTPELSPFAVGNSIRLGLQIENVYGLSLPERTFKAEGWYWLKWSESINRLLNKKSLAAEDLIRFKNLVDDDALSIGMSGTSPVRNSDNEYYKRFHFSGMFYIPDLSLAFFPVYRLELPIVFELRPIGLACHEKTAGDCVGLVLDAGSKGSMLGDYAEVNGFNLKGIRVSERAQRQSVNYGIDASIVSGVMAATVIYDTSFYDAFWQYIFPVFVLVVMGILSLSLPGSLGDIRVAIPSTLLLTLIFLQLGYRSELPALAYSTYLDWLYTYAYLVSIALFAMFCWGTSYYSKSVQQCREEQALREINRLDLIMQLTATAGLIAFSVFGLLMASRF
jgi:hypothetical protein